MCPHGCEMAFPLVLLFHTQKDRDSQKKDKQRPSLLLLEPVCRRASRRARPTRQDPRFAAAPLALDVLVPHHTRTHCSDLIATPDTPLHDMAMDFPSSTATTAAAGIDASATAAAALLRRESLSMSFAANGDAATAELVRSLPELIEQLQLLRGEMAKSAKIYDAIAAGDVKTHQPVSGNNNNNNSSSRNGAPGSYGRQSIFTPFAADTPPEPYAPIDRDSVPLEVGDLAGGAALQRHNSKRGHHHQPQQPQYPQYQQQPPQRLPRADSRRPAGFRNVDYTVMWVSGECGISLRNFSTNKIGAQIAVLQQADGVTTGIANCRLGDQLVSVNDDVVDAAPFKDIVQTLKTTRRPITLGFRTNPNVATSPVAGPSMRAMPSRHSSGANRAGSTRAFFPPDDESHRSSRGRHQTTPPTSLTRTSSGKAEDAAAGGFPEERTTDASLRSSTSTLSDEVESWCKEQEEMHSGLLVLLTETVMRCEKLQQENLDQLQNWMQVAPSLYSSTASSSKSDGARVSTTGSDSD